LSTNERIIFLITCSIIGADDMYDYFVDLLDSSKIDVLYRWDLDASKIVIEGGK
jgi:hypothetical protein